MKIARLEQGGDSALELGAQLAGEGRGEVQGRRAGSRGAVGRQGLDEPGLDLGQGGLFGEIEGGQVGEGVGEAEPGRPGVERREVLVAKVRLKAPAQAAIENEIAMNRPGRSAEQP